MTIVCHQARLIKISLLFTSHGKHKASCPICLVPKPHYSARPKRFGSLGPSENVRPRQKSSKVRELSGAEMVIKTSGSHFKVKNTPLKHTDEKGSLKLMLSFLQDDKGRLFFLKIVLRGIQNTRPIGTLGLFWNAIKQRSFLRIFRYILYSIGHLPSPCTAFFQSLSVNLFRWRIRGEPTGNA